MQKAHILSSHGVHDHQYNNLSWKSNDTSEKDDVSKYDFIHHSC